MREPDFDFHISDLLKLLFNHSESCWVEGSVGPSGVVLRPEFSKAGNYF